MSLLSRSALLVVLAAPIAAGPGQAQRLVLPASAAPTCASQGINRVALSLPPGRTREDLTASIQAGEIFPIGTEAFILPEGQNLAVKNGDHMRERANRMLGATLSRGLKVEGTVSVLLTIDPEGKVTETIPNTRNGEFDRLLDTLWKEALFEPVVIHGCRPTVMFHMPVHFESDFDLTRRGIRMGWGHRPPG